MIKGGTAELLYIYTDVEPVTFNRGFYSIDMRFFYRVTLQVLAGYTVAETQIENLVVAQGYADCVAFMGADSISVVAVSYTHLCTTYWEVILCLKLLCRDRCVI